MNVLFLSYYNAFFPVFFLYISYKCLILGLYYLIVGGAQ